MLSLVNLTELWSNKVIIKITRCEKGQEVKYFCKALQSVHCTRLKATDLSLVQILSGNVHCWPEKSNTVPFTDAHKKFQPFELDTQVVLMFSERLLLKEIHVWARAQKLPAQLSSGTCTCFSLTIFKTKKLKEKVEKEDMQFKKGRNRYSHIQNQSKNLKLLN